MNNTSNAATLRRKGEYTAPTIENLEARVEKGFAGSRFDGTAPNNTIGDRYQDGGDKSTLFT